MRKERMRVMTPDTTVAYRRSHVRRRVSVLVPVSLTVAVMFCVLGVSIASASFGVSTWDGQIPASKAGAVYTQAGGHPFEISTTVGFNSHEGTDGIFGFPVRFPDAPIKDVFADSPPGLMANATVLQQCTSAQLATFATQTGSLADWCPIGSQVGVIYVNDENLTSAIGANPRGFPAPLFNMVPPAGVPVRFAFQFEDVVIALDGGVRGEGAGFHVTVDSHDISQSLPLTGVTVVLWGTPADPAHDGDRCEPKNGTGILGPFASPYNLCEESASDEGGGPHSVAGQVPDEPFLTMPTACTTPGEGLRFDVAIDSWDNPGAFEHASYLTHEPPAYPESSPFGAQRGVENCDVVPSDPGFSAQPTNRSAASPTGLSVEVSVPTDGLLNPEGIAQSHLKRVEVTLPEGMTVNPSAGGGLGVCTPAQYAAETATPEPGAGCPSTSKLGTVRIETPLLGEPLEGSLYLAQPDNPGTSTPGAENPFDSLLAIYIVAKDPYAGVILKLPGKVAPDPVTGQLTTTVDDLPQAAFSKFTLSFREGARAPLVTPPLCGTYTTTARFVPYSSPGTTITRSSSFDVTEGVNGGPCPAGGAPPFHPQLQAGTINNNAGSYSPIYIRLSRNDGEQEISSFSSDLPPGLSGSLTGIPFCTDAQIALARTKTGSQETSEPSCPASSQIGDTLVGAGVGSVLVYAPGKVYLAGPYNGSALSVVAITSATVGPFDLGTVVVRFALRIDKSTAQVHVDAKGSDPIPHIIEGIVVHVRDIRVYMDREHFTLNPTSCNPMSFDAGVSAFEGASLTDAIPFQAASCAALAFKPVFNVTTPGRTSRSNGAGLSVKLSFPTTGPNEANIAKVKVDLPKQLPSRLTTLQKACPDHTFNANPAACPTASMVGRATATTPILPVALTGPAYFVSHGGAAFPDLVVVLEGYGITVDLVGTTFISKAGITSSTFKSVPDVPVGTFELTLPQGKDSALAANGNLCTAHLVMPTAFVAQNGAEIHQSTPIRATGCPKNRAHRANKHKKGKR